MSERREEWVKNAIFVRKFGDGMKGRRLGNLEFNKPNVGVTTFWLYYTKIATVDMNAKTLKVETGGYKTHTTHACLKAVCQAVGLRMVPIQEVPEEGLMFEFGEEMEHET